MDRSICSLTSCSRRQRSGAHIEAQGFERSVTREIAQAKRSVEERYEGQQEKRYGLLAFSKARNLTAHGIYHAYSVPKKVREGPWYADRPAAPNSCCQLQ